MNQIEKIKAEIINILYKNKNIKLSLREIREKSSFLSEIYQKELKYANNRNYSKAYYSKISFAINQLRDKKEISYMINAKDKREYLYSLY